MIKGLQYGKIDLHASGLCDFDMNKGRILLLHSGDQFREIQCSWIDEGRSCCIELQSFVHRSQLMSLTLHMQFSYVPFQCMQNQWLDWLVRAVKLWAGLYWSKIMNSIILTNKSVWCLMTPCLFLVWWSGFAKDRTVLRHWRQLGGFLLARLFFFGQMRVGPLYTDRGDQSTRCVLGKCWV